MNNETPAGRSGAGAFFDVLERVVLFALSFSVGLVNLLIGLAVAAHLGLIPKAAGDRVLRAASRATAVVTRIMAPAPNLAPKRRTKP
jgi:hypothetical protein